MDFYELQDGTTIFFGKNDDEDSVYFEILNKEFDELACMNVEMQQLGELGGLFLSLAGKFDFSSVGELLDGYEHDREKLKENLLKLIETL